MAGIFTDADRLDMLVASYAFGHLADAVEGLPVARSHQFCADMIGDLSPADAPPTMPSWTNLADGVAYAAYGDAQLQARYGRGAVEAYYTYHDENEAVA